MVNADDQEEKEGTEGGAGGIGAPKTGAEGDGGAGETKEKIAEVLAPEATPLIEATKSKKPAGGLPAGGETKPENPLKRHLIKLLIFLGSVFMAWVADPSGQLPLFTAGILVYIGLWLGIRSKKNKLEASGRPAGLYTFLNIIFLLVFIAGLYMLADFYSREFYDRPLLGTVGEGGLGFGQRIEDFRASSGISAPLNVFTAVLLGKFDPDAQKWDSRRVRESYVVPEDFGVVFDNIAPSRSVFYGGSPPDDLEISGDMTVVSLFEEGELVSTETPLIIGVEVPRCNRQFADVLELLPGTEDTGKWCREAWNCDIPGETKSGNRFSISKAYNRFFVCQHPGLDVKADMALHPRAVWKYTTQAVSGRQLFVAHPDTLARIEDLRTHYNIPKSSFEPWSINDGTANFGIGFDRDVEFLRAEGPKDSPGRFTRYFLGASLENTGTGEIVRINDLELAIPSDENIVVLGNDNKPISKTKGEVSGDFEFDRTEQFGNDIPVDIYKLKQPRPRNFLAGLTLLPGFFDDVASPGEEPIQPGFFKTYYLQISINKDYLQNTAYQSFFARATVSYDYQQEKGTTLTIEKTPFGD